uniref:Uncharacterized protein n=1 Tax=Ananas comosus var. bracteatus TaxID=296719 RepID=A0A6V7PKF5_ANACO|nr:unnamed protein product [Ananas comosus var. bracteatus]
MSLENEDRSLPESFYETKSESKRKSKLSYTREFLLSFSDLDVCKKLPKGFDASILSEFEDASGSLLERQRGSGGYSRGSSARWDTRSSGSSDKDGDLQLERESFMPDKRLVNQSRRSWQHTEHDGLLGSGAFPRPSSYAGPSAPKARGGGQYQLNRSTEPYQPPRPYKAVPFARKDYNDARNDETFGSSECSSQERAEEEKKGEVKSFELMRKEQKLTLQEKHKQITDNYKENHDDDMIALLQNSADKNSITNRSKKPDDDNMTSSSVSKNDSSKPSSVGSAPPSRPLVPPGFANAVGEKKIHKQSSSTFAEPQARNEAPEENLPLDKTGIGQQKENQSASSTDVRRSEAKSTSHIANEVGKLGSSFSSSREFNSIETIAYRTSSVEKVNELREDDILDDYASKKEASSKILSSATQDRSTSILEKLFGSSSSKSSVNSPTYVENLYPKVDEDTVPLVLPESSKFARWFPEEEDFSSKDLLSLIVDSEKAGQVSSASNAKTPKHISLSSPFENFLPTSVSTAVISEKHPQSENSNSSPVLTCEDLEQLMLAEASKSTSNVQLPVEAHWSVVDDQSKEQKPNVNNHASQHLLSLLHKGPKQETPSSPGLHVAANSNPEKVNSSEKSLTLEALFGAQFMNALQSVEAPVSVRIASANHLQDQDYVNSQVQHLNLGGAGFDERGPEIRLPEEDSLLAMNDPLDSLNRNLFPFAKPSKSIEELNEKLANLMPRDMERVQTRGQIDSEIRYHHHLQDRQFSQLPHPMNQTRPNFPSLDHLEAIHHDPHHPFPANVIPHHGGPWIDPAAAAHHLMLQQMPPQGNFPPPQNYPLQGMPRGIHVSHPIHQMPGFVPEMNNVHNFPPHHRQPDYGGLGMAMPGLATGEGGSSRPEALERLIQMELRAKSSKEVHPALAGHVPNIYGPELGMNFQYR